MEELHIYVGKFDDEFYYATRDTSPNFLILRKTKQKAIDDAKFILDEHRKELANVIRNFDTSHSIHLENAEKLWA